MFHDQPCKGHENCSHTFPGERLTLQKESYEIIPFMSLNIPISGRYSVLSYNTERKDNGRKLHVRVQVAPGKRCF